MSDDSSVVDNACQSLRGWWFVLMPNWTLWFFEDSMDQCAACQLHLKRAEESDAGRIIQVERTVTSFNKLKVTSSV